MVSPPLPMILPTICFGQSTIVELPPPAAAKGPKSSNAQAIVRTQATMQQ
jgi:hypothetical protein